MRVDLHTHTNASPDASIPPGELLDRAMDARLDRIAVTDHGTLDGALAAQELSPDRVIVGEEVRCRCGTELIGLFLREEIPSRLPLEEVVERIREQGGVVYAPHPYAYPWRPVWRARRALAVADVVEVFNARAFLPAWNRAAGEAARMRSLGAGAGSDAHFAREIGRAYTEMPAFDGPSGFLEAIRTGRCVGLARTHPAAHVGSLGLKVLRKAAGFRTGLRPLPQPRTAQP